MPGERAKHRHSKRVGLRCGGRRLLGLPKALLLLLLLLLLLQLMRMNHVLPPKSAEAGATLN